VATAIRTVRVPDLTVFAFAASSHEFSIDGTFAASANGDPFATNLNSATTDDAATLNAAVQYGFGPRSRLRAECRSEIDAEQPVRSANTGLTIMCLPARVIPSRRISRNTGRRHTRKPLRLSG
jgi:hypothetical protein